jgi:heme oxygenase (biliverdin-IX-beta and delta-forming)
VEPIVAQLRQGTSSLHEGLERALPLLQPGLTRGRYRTHLERSLGFMAPLERRLADDGAWSYLGLDADERRRAGLLVQDLQALGASAAELSRLPRCHALPRLEPRPRALGCLYVLEGSTLGGLVLTHRLEESLGVTPACGSAYLAGHGRETGRLWRAFLAALEAADEARARTDEVVEGARDTFVRLQRWLGGAPG